jgi:hypothetical protein
MTRAAATAGELAAIDFALSIMDSPRRPLDFTLLFHLSEAPSLESLRAGAKSARNLYPTTGSRIQGDRWLRLSEPVGGITSATTTSSATLTDVVQDFLAHPIDLGSQMPVQQLVVGDGVTNGVKLVTRFHHAAADGLSAAQWIGHQLRVASGKEPPVVDVEPFQELPLRAHDKPARKSRFAYRGASQGLWTSQSGASGSRLWRTIEIKAGELRAGCRRVRGFTYNDLLATCALEVFALWNRVHDNHPKPKIGLWLPVNIRREAATGFGNGTGRIRIYARYADQISFVEKCREVRQQVSWSTKNGEWAVPRKNPLQTLPRWAAAAILRSYLNRPGVDMATGVFSHAERWTGERGEIFDHVQKIESIGQLHKRHSVTINGATHHGRTWLTFTYDPGLMSLDDISCFVEMYQNQIELARRELRCAA